MPEIRSSASAARRVSRARPTVPMQVHFPVPLHDKLWEVAEARQVSASQVVRDAVAESLRSFSTSTE